jgi:hypothetical protein
VRMELVHSLHEVSRDASIKSTLTRAKNARKRERFRYSTQRLAKMLPI